MPDYLNTAQIKRIAEQTLPPTYREPYVQAFFGADPSFYLPSLAQMKNFMKHAMILPPVDIGAGFDCDDYAYALKGSIGIWNRNYTKLQTSWCVGVIFARFSWMGDVDHAANWFIDKSGTLWLIEPQTRKEYPATSVASASIKLILL